MANTLIEICKDVAFEVGVSTTFTSFSDNDDSNLLKYYVNKAYLEIFDQILPRNSIYNNTQTGTITTVSGTRVYALDINTDHFKTDDLRFRINEGVNLITDLAFYNKQDVLDEFKDASGTIAKPYIVYVENATQFGLFPVPDATYTIEYYYTPNPVKLTQTTDTFLVPDSWLRLYVTPKASFYYLASKEFPDAPVQAERAIRGSGVILATTLQKTPIFINNYYD
jgi:hypothetical protein